jgi:uncharacterized protein (TIGR02588 family)
VRRRARRRDPGRRGGEEHTQLVRDAGRSVAEWTSLGISLAIVLTLVGLVAYQHFVGATRPPAIEVRPLLDAVRRVDGQYYVPIEITNRGDLTAQDVRVQIVLGSEQRRGESATLAVDFLAGGATAHATVIFGEDPAQRGLTVGSTSFLGP